LRPYRFVAEARNEFQEQVAYFDDQVPGLGDKFIMDVEAAVRSIREHPDSGSPVSNTVRKKVLGAFPFNIFYVVADAEIVIVQWPRIGDGLATGERASGLDQSRNGRPTLRYLRRSVNNERVKDVDRCVAALHVVSSSRRGPCG
jgi:hypothetical protein